MIDAFRAFRILANRRAEEMRLLNDESEASLEEWEEAVHARATAGVESQIMSGPQGVI